MKKSLFFITLMASVIIAITFGGCRDSIGESAITIDSDSATVTYFVKSTFTDIQACGRITDSSSNPPRLTRNWPGGSRFGHDIQYGISGNLQFPICEYIKTDPVMIEGVHNGRWNHYYTVDTSEGWTAEQEVPAGTTVRLLAVGNGIVFNAGISVNGEDCASAEDLNGTFDFTCEIGKQ